MGRRIDIAGQRFGKLVALQDVGKNRHGSRLWWCQCDCGRRKVIPLAELRQGGQISCGCVRRSDNSALNALYSRYKSGAKERTLHFKLALDKFAELTSDNCFYCGIAPEQIMTVGENVYTYNGIDRIDSNVGYESNNCVPCCKVCNRAKSDMPFADFQAWIARLKIQP